jgi:RNA polymerase sigma-70 factor (ECF subfamily)
VPLEHDGEIEPVALDLRSSEGSHAVDRSGALRTGSRPQDAFAGQARQCLPQLYRIARRLTSQQADAEDLVHDTYLKAFQAADRVRLDSADDCRAWLTRILVNTFRDQYRQRLRSPFISAAGDGMAKLIEFRASPEPGPAERIEVR